MASKASYQFWSIVALLTAGVSVLFVLSLLTGPADLSPAELFTALFRGDDVSEAILLVIREIRLPRSLLALLIGMALGLSGAALQGWLLNPLAEPGLIGVSGGAAFGAVLAFYFGLAAQLEFAVPLAGIAGGFVAVTLVYLLAGNQGSPLTLILAGIAVSAFSGALTSLALNMSANPFAAMEIVFWLMGSLADRSMDHVRLAAPFILVGSALLLTLGRALDAVSLGEDVAATLGVSLQRTQIVLIAGTALSVGAATSVAGTIGFVGLIAPHLLRPFCGGRPSRLLLLAALGGAMLLLASDIAVRMLTPDREMRLGVLTALLGAPFFLMLILKARRSLMS